MSEFQSSKRKRGVILTQQGEKRLLEAIYQVEEEAQDGKRLSRERIAGITRFDISTVNKVLGRQKRVDRATLAEFFRAFSLELTDSDCDQPTTDVEPEKTNPVPETATIAEEMPDVGNFFGRGQELQKVKDWLIRDRCRLIIILGMGGIRKTTLAAKLCTQIQEKYPDEFEFIIWKSLRNAIPLADLLVDLLKVLSKYQRIELPEDESSRIGLLITELKKRRCLLILDNVETILQEEQSGSCEFRKL